MMRALYALAIASLVAACIGSDAAERTFYTSLEQTSDVTNTDALTCPPIDDATLLSALNASRAYSQQEWHDEHFVVGCSVTGTAMRGGTASDFKFEYSGVFDVEGELSICDGECCDDHPEVCGIFD